MAQTDRTFIADIAIYALGGTSYLGTVKNCTIKRSVEKKESVAAKDANTWPLPGRRTWTSTGGVCVEGTATILALVGTSVTVSIKESTAGQTYAGTALVSEGEHNFGGDNDGQVETFTLDGQGALTKS